MREEEGLEGEGLEDLEDQQEVVEPEQLAEEYYQALH